MTKEEAQLLRSYENGPRIWDVASIVPLVFSLAQQGMIEPVPDTRGAYRLTDAGWTELMG